MKCIHSIRGILEEKGSQVLTVSPDTRVFDALGLMAEHDIGAVVVMEDGQPVGMFSERDYARKVILQGKSSRGIAVREVMQTPVLSVHPGQTIDECMSIMTYSRVRHLPVIDGERMVGLVSIGDMVKWLISAQDDTIHQLENYIEGKYPA